MTHRATEEETHLECDVLQQDVLQDRLKFAGNLQREVKGHGAVLGALVVDGRHDSTFLRQHHLVMRRRRSKGGNKKQRKRHKFKTRQDKNSRSWH